MANGWSADDATERTARGREIEELLEAARTAQARLTALYAQLALHPDPEGPLEAELTQRLEERRQLVHRLGLAVFQAASAGATLGLTWTEPSTPLPPAAEAAPAPIPPVAPDPVLAPAAAVVAPASPVEVAAPTAPAPELGGAPAEVEPVAPQPPAAPTIPVPTPAVAQTPPPLGRAVIVPPPGLDRRPAPGPAADASTLLRLAQRGLGPNWQDPEPRRSVDATELLHAAMDALGPPLVVDDEDTLEQEARRISRESDRMERWLQIDRLGQQLLISYAAAKARYLQERAREGAATATAVAGLDPAFRLMNRYSKEYRPGFVWGLSRSHTPKRGSWLEDAEQYWQELLDLAGRSPRVDTNPERALAKLEKRLETEPQEEEVREAALDALASGVSPADPRLQRLLEPYIDALTGRPLRALRRSLRHTAEDDDDTDEALLVPEDWPCFGWTEGKLAIVVGGDRRAEAAARLQEAFRFDEVEWDSDVQGTKLVNIGERIHRRSVGMVIFLARLSSHGAQAVLLEACKQAEVPFVRIERGYGVTAVRLAIEQLFGQAALTSTR